MANSKSKANVQKKGGFVKFFKEVRAEMKKVIWPTRRELINNTIAVFVMVLIVTAVLGAVDAVFSRLFQLLLHSLG